MQVGSWKLVGGRIALFDSENDSIFPSAVVVYDAAFSTDANSDQSSIRRCLPDLTFSRFPAKPLLRLKGTAESGLRLDVGTDPTNDFFPLSRGVDQVIRNTTWYPLISDELEEVFGLLDSLGIDPSEELSLGDFVKLQKLGPIEFLKVELDISAVSLGQQIVLESGSVSGLRANLYEYQRTGIAFLQLIESQRIGCILGDEMGLGKTLQVIGLIVSTWSSENGPALVVCPSTLLENWRRELQTFAPEVRVHVHAGGNRARTRRSLPDADVFVTSYDLLIRDEVLLSGINWHIVVLDEAQYIKSPSAQRTLVAKGLPRKVSIAVTGTPVENRLEDLWSVMDFAIPGYLGDLGMFRQSFPDNFASAGELGQRVAPWLLRRRVADVATDLPRRIDIPLPIELGTAMSQGYESIRQSTLDKHGRSGGLAALTNLRMYSTHPFLLNAEPFSPDDLSMQMPKYQSLIDILEEIFSNAEKAIIFTSFTGMIEGMQRDFRMRWSSGHFDVIYGDVVVSRRQRIVDEFSGSTSFGALILNPRAGGVGLNITAANHVIHYNPEWNPAITDQASARSHRRRQERPVTVHELYFVNTIEEVIIERAKWKREMSADAAEGVTDLVEDRFLLRALQASPLG